MKRHLLQITLLILFGALLSNLAVAQQLRNDGDDCDNPIIAVIDNLPYTYTDNRTEGTCGHGNNHYKVSDNYTNGEDVFYKIIVPSKTNAKISLEAKDGDQSTSPYHAIYLFKGCPSADNNHIARKTATGATVALNAVLEANEEYFIIVDYFGVSNANCLKEYTLEVECSADIEEEYGLMIANKKVTSQNAGDLSVIEGISGEISYNNDTKTLTLNNAKIETSFGIVNQSIENLKIKILGKDTIKTPASIALKSYTDFEISGTGSLSVEGGMAAVILQSGAGLFVKNCQVDMTANMWGIAGAGDPQETLTIQNAEVKIHDTQYGCIVDIESLTLTDCAITEPAGAVFDTETHAVVLGSEKVTDKVVITPQNTTTAVESVSLDFETAEIATGETKQLTATVLPAEATNKDVTWRSTANDIATVTSGGLVTGVSAGNASIIVTTEDGEKTDTCEVTVTTIAVTDITLTPDSISLAIGSYEVLKPNILPPNASNKNVSWTSTADNIATVTSGGLVTGVLAGNALIIVTTEDGNKSDTCKVTVKAIAVTGVTLDAPTAELKIGATKKLNETVLPTNATNKNVSWTSTADNIATVDDNGLVTAISAGNALIIVTTEDGKKSDTCEVTVSKIDVETVVLNLTAVELKVDETKQLNATVLPENATNKNIGWESSDDKIATVDETGLVKAISAGKASIIVTTKDGEKTDTCKVTVIENPTAVNDIAKSEFAVYPTVVENGFNIEVNANLVNSNLEVYNLLGVKVLSQKITAQKQYINVSNLASGVYAVRLNGKTSKIVKK